jgi:hypothetical protein
MFQAAPWFIPKPRPTPETGPTRDDILQAITTIRSIPIQRGDPSFYTIEYVIKFLHEHMPPELPEMHPEIAGLYKEFNTNNLPGPSSHSTFKLD